MTLDPVQARVLGTLIEKEIVTPENYPLSLNALVAGCNQKSSRDPVMNVGEDEVRRALHLLQDQGLTSITRDARVPKFEHQARTILNLRRDETALLCLLLLRGPQTPGELRGRADRMYSFDDIAAVESTLSRLTSSAVSETPQGRVIRPIVAALPRPAGSREVRYMHLLSGPPSAEAASSAGTPSEGREAPADADSRAVLVDRIKELEGHMEALRAMMRRLEARLESQSDQSGDSDSGIGG